MLARKHWALSWEEFSQNALNHMNRRNSFWMNGLSKCSQRYADTHTVLSELSE
jgi:hypothetical protein